MIKSLFAIILLCFSLNSSVLAADSGGSMICPSADIFTGIMDQVCWSCFLPLKIMGVGDSKKTPDGSRGSNPACMCTDRLGIPDFGWSLSMWMPKKIIEVVKTPWCSPALQGTRLQKDLFGLGKPGGSEDASSDGKLASMQYHYFSYPLFAMLEMFVLTDCNTDGFSDFDLQYVSEIDPTWQNDITAILLNPEAIIFANPLAKMWCAADCVATTAGAPLESSYGCAGCDGSLYPFTGNVIDADDPVRASSLLAQRALASMHRRGIAKKTMGEDNMCSPSFWPMLPKSQYKLSMIYPVPEATSTDEQECCHGLGESIHSWSTAAGGRTRPGKENYLYLLWIYRDCCVRQ